MLKFVHKGMDKILLIDGTTVATLEHVRKLSDVNDKYWWATWGEAGEGINMPGRGSAQSEPAESYVKCHIGHGWLTSAPGGYLSNVSIGQLGKYLYTIHGVARVESEHTAWPDRITQTLRNLKMLEWDGVESNVTNEIGVTPSGQGARYIWGYVAGFDKFGIAANDGLICAGADVGFINYKGNLLGLGCAFKVDTDDSYNSYGDEAIKIIGQNAATDTVANLPFYYTFLYNQIQNTGSGLTTFNFLGPGIAASTDKSIGHFPLPAWMDYYGSYENDYILQDAPLYNFNIIDMVEFRERIYATNACHLLSFLPRFGSSGVIDVDNDFRILYATSGNAYYPTPKWLSKCNGNLYMLEADGQVSQIIPDANNIDVTVSGITDLSYLDADNVRYGGIHSREWGIERATKNALFTYQNRLHAIFGMGSGTYHLSASQDDLSYWPNHTSGLPTRIREHQGNVYTYEDSNDGNLYVLFTSMQTQGALGLNTFRNTSAGLGYLYSYDGTTWTQHGDWFPLCTFGSAGGFIGFDYEGPHVIMASGHDYPINEIPEASGSHTTPILYKCKDYAVLDYQLVDQLSRNIDVTIEFSINDGCDWSTCYRFKSYETFQYLGDGTTALSSSPSGEWHTFYWDFVKSIGYNVDYPYCKLRIVPQISNTQ